MTLATALLACGVVAPAAHAQSDSKTVVVQTPNGPLTCDKTIVSAMQIHTCLPRFPTLDKRIFVSNVLGVRDANYVVLMFEMHFKELVEMERDTGISIISGSGEHTSKIINNDQLWKQLTFQQKTQLLKAACKHNVEFDKSRFTGTAYTDCVSAAAESKKDRVVFDMFGAPDRTGPVHSNQATSQKQIAEHPTVLPEIPGVAPAGGEKLGGDEAIGGTPVERALARGDGAAAAALIKDGAPVPQGSLARAVELLTAGGPEPILTGLRWFGARLSDEQRATMIQGYVAKGGDLPIILEEIMLSQSEAEMIYDAALSSRERKKLQKITIKPFVRK